MKRKNWKKSAAFVTSVAMAASMMPVELTSVIVNAADSAIVAKGNDTSLNVNTFEVGDYFEDDVEFKLPTTDAGKNITVNAIFDDSTDTSDPADGVIDAEDFFNVVSIKYEKSAEGTNQPKLTLTNREGVTKVILGSLNIIVSDITDKTANSCKIVLTKRE